MSDFRSVAAVTAVLRSVLDEAAKAAVDGAEATTERPDRVQDGDTRARVNLFLYQVTPNGSWRNDDLPTRRGDGTLARRPRSALDLHYLLTFFGSEAQQVPQRLLGRVVSALHVQPLLSRELIQRTVDAVLEVAPDSYLAGSDLVASPELVRFTPIVLNLEELSKLWSVFFQVPYFLSIAYQASVVLIEPEATPGAGLPVRARNLYIAPFRRPAIESAAPRADHDAPVVAGTLLAIRGRRLRGEDIRVEIGGVEVEPDAVTDTEVTVRLASPPMPEGSLRAGIVALRVVHRRLLGTPPTPHAGAESNVLPVIVRPTVEDLEVEQVPEDPEADEPTLFRVLRTDLDPAAHADQRALLLLEGPGGSYAVPARPRSADDEPVRFPLADVAAGEYLVRVQVDGADSLLEADASGAFSAPTVEVPE
ncbi:MAG TPA: DUF4255 domain-containing protein [Thermoanaerobaculia bacterium]|nr:DUF4255 domain-containing protein [Thermoanaerobaculia bacterium]